jgi:chromate reductase, NAD(P)H dehydrogenase (quinone)
MRDEKQNYGIIALINDETMQKMTLFKNLSVGFWSCINITNFFLRMISIVVGTNRPNSKSRQVALFYQKLLNNLATENQIIDLAELPDDFARSALYENNGKNEAFNVLKHKMRDSDKFVFVVPEYNGSFPGVLKTFIDGLGYPSEILHKKAALVGVSDGVQGGALALSHLTDVFNYLGLNVLAQRVKVPFMKKNFIDGTITDAFIAKLFDEQAELLVKF